MKTLALLIFAFAVIQLIIAVINLIFSQQFPRKKNEPKELISILIPARNEEQNIGNILGDLLRQEYQNFEVLVYDDESTDGTSAVVRQFMEKDRRVKLITSQGLPEGWLGKNHACHQLAQHAKGRYFLFLDADVRLENDVIAKALSFLMEKRLALLSIFPRQIMVTSGEKMTVPLMHFILLSLLPLVLVRKTKHPALAAANGQFMLFDAETYKSLLPHKNLKHKRVEDIAIAQWLKSKGYAVACVAGIKEISCRMYHSYAEAVRGFSRNVAAFFGNSLLFAFLFWFVTTFGFLFVWSALGESALWSYVIVVLATRVVVSYASDQLVLENLLYLLPQHFAMGHIVLLAIIQQRKKSFTWKGRRVF